MKTEWSAVEFARHLKECCDTDDFRLAFFLGAGCSKTSGIPTAGELVSNKWLPKLMMRKTGKSDGNVGEWARDAVESYDPENPAMSYPKIIKECFPFQAQQQREIEEICKNHLPGFGYAVLTKLFEKKHETFNTLITTNFDDLIADAFYLFTTERPLVILHEALGGFISSGRTRPMIVKIHGDSKISPLNTTEELGKIDSKIDIPVKNLLTEMGLVFIGYGGNDEGIVKMLAELPPQAKHHPVYWLGRKQPEGVIREWLDSREAIFVDSAGFDETMLFINNEFELNLGDKSRFDKVFESVEETFKKLNSKIESMDDASPGSSELKKAAKATAKSLPDWMQVILSASSFEKSDPDRAEKIYLDGIGKLPNSVQVLGRFAVFLTEVPKDYDRAEEYYTRAIEADPNHASNLGNYALFLKKMRKDYDRAEEYYKRSIDADPNHANHLGNYANFLEDTRKDFDQAEEYYTRAIEADPNHANNFGNYGGFLLAKGERGKGFGLLGKCKTLPEFTGREDLQIELFFYEFAHGDIKITGNVLGEIKNLIQNGARSEGWDFSRNIARAKKDKHPEEKWLDPLADVISGKADPKTLDKWKMWKDA